MIRPGLAWVVVAALIALPAAWVGVVTPQSSLVLHPSAGWAAQTPWAWWSPVWAHLSEQHLAGNLAMTVLLGAIGWRAGVRTDHAMVWALAWPLTHAILMLDPRLAWYAGASAVLHAGVAVLGVALWSQGRHVMGPLILGGLALKVCRDVIAGQPLADGVFTDVPIATLSHAAGTLAGLILAGIHQARLSLSPSGRSD